MQFRFTYPKMKSPSMYITQEDEKGVILVYRSGRHGFTHYLMGMDNNLIKYNTPSIIKGFTTQRYN